MEYKIGDIALIAWFFAIFMGALFFTFLRSWKRPNVVDFLIAATGFVALTDFSGVRDQEYSFLFFAVLLYLLYHPNKKLIWLAPPLFIIWVNFHGGFMAGLMALGIYFLSKLYYWLRYRQEKDLIKYCVIGALSSLATLVNPYGIRVYEVIIITLKDSYITKLISEWQSLIFNFPMRYVIFLAILAVFYPAIRKHAPKHSLLLILAFFVLSVKSIKYTPYFIITILPVMFLASKDFLSPAHIAHYKKIATSWAILFLAPILIGAAVLFYDPNIIYVGSETGYPSNEAIEFLKKDDSKRVFDYYNWGGYLIRHVPEKQYFVDGRMPSWREGDLYPFKDFVDAGTCEGTEKIFNKFSVDIVVWPSKTDERKLFFETDLMRKIDKFIAYSIFRKEEEKTCDFLKELDKLGWKKVFDDGNASIYKK